ncbi:MAG: DinB family protein, partial [Terriglobia bacterium]
MDVNERERYSEIVKQTPARLAATLKGVPKKLLLWTPSPGKWSIHEIVCHMRDMERDAYLARYHR